MNSTWVNAARVYGVPPKNLSPDALVGGGSTIIFPELLVLKGRCRVDSQTYISVGLEMGDRTVVCPGAKLIGGKERRVVMGQWSFVGWNSLVMARSEDYAGLIGVGFGAPGPAVEGDVVFEPFSGLASMSSCFPGVRFPEGAVVGMHSMVHSGADLVPWYIHKGVPAKPWKKRDKNRVMAEYEAAVGRMGVQGGVR